MFLRRFICPLAFAILLLVVWGCNSSTDPALIVEATIQEEVADRIRRAEATIMDRCRDAVLEEAGLIADSILFERARLRRDTAARPDRPYRPGKPPIKELKDSVPVAPLFDSLPFRRDTIHK